MSTRSVIARIGEHEQTFAGRYVHADGMPTSMGAELWKLYHGFFKRDLNKMLTYLIDAPHAQAGWSGIVGKDFKLKPGYTWQKATADGAKYEVYSTRPDYRRPQCFAGHADEEPCLFTETDLEQGTDIEWVYAFDETEHKLYIRDVSAKEDVSVIDLNGPEPNWTEAECGANFERCKHYAWVHKLAPNTCNLSTQTWLGNRPLEMRDAIAVEIGGKLLKLTGSGGDADFLNKANFHTGRMNVGTPLFPSGTWVATCVHKNGRRVELPIAKRVDRDYQPLPGVTWIFPALKDQPASRRVG